jgi:hypothetical protein
VSTQTDTFMLGGGLNLVAPYLAIKPGQAIEALNFEPGLSGGYRRINGYERFDGRAKPSEQGYTMLQLSDVAGIVVDSTVTGATSGATAVVVGVDSANGAIGVTAITGAFQAGESLGGGITLDAVGVGGGAVDSVDSAWRLVAQNHYRALIQAVPGSGRVLGVIRHENETIAFRNNEGGTEAIAYQASPAGWVAMTFGRTLRFKLGTGLLNEGDTITTATGAGVIKKVIVYSGATQTSDASGYLVLSGVTGTLTSGQAIQVGGVTKATADGDSSAISFLPGGLFSFAQHNFYAATGTYNLYGCDGVNSAWEWDGETLSPVLMPDLVGAPFANAPTRIMAHKGHLFLALAGGSLQHSVVGEPLTFNGFLGAAEFGLGAEITDLASQAGDVLLAYTRRATFGLYGAGIADWQLKPVAPEAGAIFGTTQVVGYSMSLDDRGLTMLQRTQAYGNFASASISQSVQPILDKQKASVTASSVVRKRNQYRLYFANGQFLIVYMPGPDKAPEFMPGQYPVAVRCMSNTEDETGAEMILFGSDDGFVYQDGVGNNFDGESIRFFVRLPFNHAKSARLRKRYRRGQLDLEANGAVQLYFAGEIDYGSPDSLQPDTVSNASIFGGGGYYDTSSWDEIYWDAQVISNARFDLDGTGVNLSLSFLGDSAVTSPFTLHSIQIDYDLRRRER